MYKRYPIHQASFDDHWYSLLCLVEMQGLICSGFSGLSHLLEPFGLHSTQVCKEKNEQNFHSVFSLASRFVITSGPPYFSFVIMSNPCTRIPLLICGAMPLNNAKGPSCSMMYDMTSVKLLKCLPFLAGGGRD